MAKAKKLSGSLIPAEDLGIESETLRAFGRRSMKDYAIAVNLERSVPNLYDGLKPVHRRILWGASAQDNRFIKTMRIAGDVMGKYHPHGDKSITDAIVTIINSPTPAMLGSGNWGSLVDNAAAPRYTETKLSGYGRSFFDPDYIHKDVTSFVPNYDDSETEPVCLPAQLPNVLLNGGEGIGVGITTNLPTFTAESMLIVMRRLIAGEKLEPKDYAKTLKFASKYGGRLVKSKENQKGWDSLFETPEGRVVFESEIEVDRDHKQMTISDWPPGTNLEKFVAKIRSMPETQRCYNSKGSMTFTIECKAAYNYAQFDKFVEKVRTATRQAKSFKIHVTHRTANVDDGRISYETEFLRLSIPKLIIKWMRMRIALELKSLAFRIAKQQKAIDHTKLLIRACDHVEDGVKALRSKDPQASLMKSMGIDAEQAKTLLNLRFIQWSKLDQSAQQAKLKEQQAHLKQLQTWEKNPKSKVSLDIEEVAKVIEKDRQVQTEKKERKFVIV
jgi:DNA gyrase/topoisomerase IV subunit A